MRSIRTLASRVASIRYVRHPRKMATQANGSTSPVTGADKQNATTAALPKLTPAEFRGYNKMAEMMDRFHSHFRQSWNMLYDACEANRRPSGMSLRQFMTAAERLIEGLTMHHTIEEQHIFPVLAKRMPAFQKELELLTQHKRIHEGLDRLEEYFADCRSGKTEFRMSEMKKIMDTFGKVLWEHLDDEVKELGAENMRKYWTLDEMRRLPM